MPVIRNKPLSRSASAFEAEERSINNQINYDGASYDGPDALLSYKCHSYEERVFDRYPCSNCGHEFCSKCTAFINNSATQETIRSPASRTSKNYLPRTPRPDTISEETDGLHQSPESKNDTIQTTKPQTMHRSTSPISKPAQQALPTAATNAQTRRAASIRSIVRSITSMSSYETPGRYDRKTTEPRNCPTAESSQLGASHCLCCVAKRSKPTGEISDLQLGGNTYNPSLPSASSHSTDLAEEGSLVPPALQLRGINSLGHNEPSYSTISALDDMEEKHHPLTDTKTCGLLPHPRTPEVEAEPWPILRRVTKPGERRVSKRKESVPWQREVRQKFKQPQAQSSNAARDESQPGKRVIGAASTEPAKSTIPSHGAKEAVGPQKHESTPEPLSSPVSSTHASFTTVGSSALSPRVTARQKHSCGWKDSILNLNAEFEQLNSELDSYDEEDENAIQVDKGTGSAGKPSPVRAHDCDDTGIEGLTIIIHLKGKDDLVINTSLRD